MKCAVYIGGIPFTKETIKQNFSHIYIYEANEMHRKWVEVHLQKKLYIKDFSYLRHISFAAYRIYTKEPIIKKLLVFDAMCMEVHFIRKSFRIYDTCI